MIKPAWFSKTLWINAVALGVALYQYYVAPIAPVNPQLFALFVAAINLRLRFMTSQPVGF